ncbi:T9SS type A sorting domain-containing protein [Lentimicrobium sp. L6]|uniref:C25 family cysteine peptidase n=1 Tax=Lentimicrobium sp. L6 TaxID=2735916 RepID=UPI001557D96B|nr:C25 family cysteine peptidase [Lentimicrobium sp. L6]NPD85325.1 T9SS type A sorting domain-containing protein [Lentimicrobium sp. L6]
MRSLLPKMSFIMVILLGFAMLSSAQSYVFDENAQTNGFQIQSSSKGAIKLSHSVHSFNLFDVEIQGENMKQLEYGLSMFPAEEGMPDLGSAARYLLIPNGAQSKVHVTYQNKVVYENIEIAPAAAIPFDTEEAKPAVKGSSYQKNAFYPAQIAQTETTEIRGMTFAIVSVNPFQYNPITKELVVYKNLEVEVEIIGGNGQYGEDRFRSKYWDQILDDIVYNAEALPKVDYSKMNKSTKEEGCEYLILVPNNDEFLPWADSIKLFRTEQGITTKVVTLDEMGGNNLEGLKDYFNTIYETWDPVPSGVLLMADYGNDDNTITSKTYPHPYSGNFITDNYFADYTGNDLPDFVFARMTGRDYAEMETMVTKFLEYERTPPTDADFYNKPITALGWQTERWFQICSETVGGYMREVLGKDPVRINAVYGGNPNNDPWSTATNTNQVTSYFGPDGLGYLPATPGEMGGWSGGTATDVVNAINDGAFILQHRDHGMESGWGEPAFTSSYINQLNNVDEIGHIFSINCLTGRFDMAGECFAEKFHRYTSGGALSLTAASQVSYSFVNDAYVWGVFDNMWPDFMPDYGGTEVEEREFRPAFGNAAGKYFLSYTNWPYNTDSKQITYRLFHHHGDAFNIVYTEVPMEMEINYSEVLVSGPDFIDIQAEEGAMIAFSVDGELIGVDEATGVSAPVTIEAQVPGTMIKVVVTKQNYYRHEGYIQVIAPDGPYVVKTGFEVDDAAGNNNGKVDFGEEIALNFSVKNLGTEMASGVEVTITCDDDLITLIDNQESFGDINVDEELSHDAAFAFTVAEEIPDNHSFVFEFSATNGTDVWESSFSIKGYAPVLEILNMELTETSGNDNGRLDPGEEATLSIQIANNGRCATPEGIANLISASDYLTVNTADITFTTIDSADMIIAEFDIESAVDASIGSVAVITTEVNAGPYSASKEFGISIGLIVEDWESGDFTQYDWSFAGNADWQIVDDESYEGEYSAKSSPIGHNQSSELVLEYEVMMEDVISFYYKVSSESGYDKLKFYIDNTEQGSWDGEVAWTEAVYSISPGVHTLKWKYVKDGSATGGSDCAWVDFIVLPPMMLPAANAGDDAQICNTETTYQLEGGAADYETLAWTTSGDGTFSANDIVDPIYTLGTDDINNGAAELTLTATSSTGSVSNTMSLEIVSTPAQAEMPAGEAIVCYQAQDMVYTIAGEGTYTWTISPEDAAIINAVGNTAYLSFNEGFAGELNLVVSEYNVCGEGPASEALAITVNEQASAAFNADASMCAGSETALSIDLTGNGPWNVEVNDEDGLELFFEATESPYELTLSPEASMNYTLMHITDANSCVGTAEGSAMVTVNELPNAILSGDAAEVCANGLVEVNVELTGASPWNLKVGAEGNEQEFEVVNSTDMIEFTVSDESMELGFISIIDANECHGNGEGSIAITVMESPSVDLGLDTIVCNHIILTLDAQNQGSAYAWSTGATDQTIDIDETMADASGDVSVSVVVTNPTGCEGSDEMMVHFQDCTGLGELSANDIALMPNPNNGLFKLEINGQLSKSADITIHNSIGEVVYTIAASNINEQIDIDLSHLSDGVYFIMIPQEQSVINKRFVIRK